MYDHVKGNRAYACQKHPAFDLFAKNTKKNNRTELICMACNKHVTFLNIQDDLEFRGRQLLLNKLNNMTEVDPSYHSFLDKIYNKRYLNEEDTYLLRVIYLQYLYKKDE